MPNAPTTGDSTITGRWTYSGDPSATNKDAVRFLVGDTLEREKLVSDEEITYALTQAASNIRYAAAWVCDHLAARFAREIDVTADDGRHDALSQRARSYRDRAVELRTIEQRFPTTAGAASPYIGGVSIDDKDTVEDNTDRVVPQFYHGQWDKAS